MGVVLHNNQNLQIQALKKKKETKMRPGLADSKKKKKKRNHTK